MLPQFVVQNTPGDRSITITDAERGRQERLIADFEARCSELSKRAQEAIIGEKLALHEMAAVRLEIAGAVTPNQVPDILKVLHGRADAIIAERAAAAKAAAKAPAPAPVTAPVQQQQEQKKKS